MGYKVHIPAMDFGRFSRPFVSVISESTPRPRTPPPEQFPETFIEWGGPSQFDISDFRNDARTLGIKGPEDEESFKPIDGIYNSQGYAWSNVTVSNPEDSSVSLDLAKIDRVSYVRQHTGSVFQKDPRHEIVNFGFTQGYTELDEIPSYLENSDGENFAPIVLDPYHTVVGISWGGPFMLVHFFLEHKHTNPGASIFLKSPRGFEDDTRVFSSNTEQLPGDPELFHSWPYAETDWAKAGLRSLFALPIEKDQQFDRHIMTFFVNVGVFWKHFMQEAFNQGTLGTPAALRWGIAAGNVDDEGAYFGKIRFELYGSSAYELLDDYVSRLSNHQFPDGTSFEDAGELMWLDQTRVRMSEERNAVFYSGSFEHHNAYDIWWDYYNKENALAYPPFGHRPEISTSI